MPQWRYQTAFCLSGRDSVSGLPHPDQVAGKNQNSAASHLRAPTAGKRTAPKAPLFFSIFSWIVRPFFFFLQHPLQSKDSEWLQELSAAALNVSQRAESLLGIGGGALLAPWRDGVLRRFLADDLPRVLGLLQHASILGQQELRSEFKFPVHLACVILDCRREAGESGEEPLRYRKNTQTPHRKGPVGPGLKAATFYGSDTGNLFLP